MMRNYRCFILAILIYMAFLPVAHAISEFPTGRWATGDKPQSKAWYHDDCWWCVMFDGETGSYFYRLAGDAWEKGALIYPEAYTRADVLSKGRTLFVLEWEALSPRLYKYVYDSKRKSYHILKGFPVELNVPEGHETMVIAQDSKGKLWIPFEFNGRVKVIYSTSPDHREWNTAGVEIADNLHDDDLASIIAFDGQIGVFWSNQNEEAFYFRTHRDGDAEDKWQKLEVVVKGQLVADDHVNLALSDDGRVFAVTKTGVDDAIEPVTGPTAAQFLLCVRSQKGQWEFYDVAEVSLIYKSRPIVVLDEEDDYVYVFYIDDKAIVSKRSPTSNIRFDGPPVIVLAKPDIEINNVTSTKQNVTSQTGLIILASGTDNKVYSRDCLLMHGERYSDDN